MTSRQTTAQSRGFGVDWGKATAAWAGLAYDACGSPLLAALVGGAAAVIGRLVERELTTEAAPSIPAVEPDIIDVVFEVLPDVEPCAGSTTDEAEPRAESAQAPPVDPQLAAAAALLGVAVDANADEIRAALRAALSSSRLHPDHGGDGEIAKRLIAAKNLLIERTKAVRP